MKKYFLHMIACLLCVLLVLPVLPANAAESRTITRDDRGDYLFHTLEDLKMLAYQTYDQQTWAYYTGEGPLVISEDMTLPENLIVYGYEKSVHIPQGVTVSLYALLMRDIVVDGTLTVTYDITAFRNGSFTVNGKLIANGYSVTTQNREPILGEENIVLGNDQVQVNRCFYVSDTADFFDMVELARSETRPRYKCLLVVESGEVVLTGDVTLPLNLIMFIWSGSRVCVKGHLVNNNYIHVESGGALQIDEAAGSYGGRGILYVYDAKAEQVGERLPGLDLDRCLVQHLPENNMTVVRWVADMFWDVQQDAFYFEPVQWAVKRGITTGTDYATFSPDDACTRGQVVTFLWRAAGQPEPSSMYNPFGDVSAEDYYYKAILWAVEKGITNGLSANAFGPNDVCNRGQVATFLHRYANRPSHSNRNPFIDVNQQDYFYDPVLWAVENGITNGMDEGIFAPGATCTRGQIVTFLYRASNIAPDDGETDEDETLEHTHNYTDTVTKPTCTTDGYTTHKCSCGDSYVDTKVTATGHSWGDWKVVKEATTTSAGSKERTCSTCKAKDTATIPKVTHSHSYTSVVTKPTCTEDGYTTYTCDCGYSYVGNKVASTGHSYTHTVTKPTCTAEGYTTHKCSKCKDSYTDTKVSATGHSWSDWVTVIAPTENSTGLARRTCSGCGDAATKTLDMVGHTHNYKVTVDYKAPTCSAAGYETKACSCGETSTTSIPAEHNWVTKHTDEVGHYEGKIVCHCGNWSASVNSDYVAGFAAHINSVDPEDKYNHSYYESVKWVVDTPAQHWQECSGCGITK